MKLKRHTLKTIIVAVLAGLLAYLNLPIPKDSVEDVVDAVLDTVASEPAATAARGSYQVRKVIDGDTFIASKEGETVTVRVLGIDTPETELSPAGVECFGGEATARAKALLTNATVVLQTDATQDEYDKYDRLLAYVEVDSRFDLGASLLADGFAKEYTYKQQAYQNQREYKDLESTAKRAEKGLWGACGQY